MKREQLKIIVCIGSSQAMKINPEWDKVALDLLIHDQKVEKSKKDKHYVFLTHEGRNIYEMLEKVIELTCCN